MKTVFMTQALDDLFYWAGTDAKILAKVFNLIADIHRHPHSGLGKPEPLKHSQHGAWSRRLTQEHRLIYRVTGKGVDQVLEIAQCRGHYT